MTSWRNSNHHANTLQKDKASVFAFFGFLHDVERSALEKGAIASMLTAACVQVARRTLFQKRKKYVN